MIKIIDKHAIKIRKKWIAKINNSNGNFSDDFSVLEKELSNEINKIKVIQKISDNGLFGIL